MTDLKANWTPARIAEHRKLIARLQSADYGKLPVHQLKRIAAWLDKVKK